MEGRAILLAVAILGAAAGATAASRSTAPGEPLLALVAEAESVEPLDQAEVERLIGARLTCSDVGNCSAKDVEAAGVKVGHVDFRFRPAGSILILEELSGACLPPESVRERYPDGQVRSSCTDGVTCLYYQVSRSWGRLSFRLPDERPYEGCVTSVVLDSFR